MRQGSGDGSLRAVLNFENPLLQERKNVIPRPVVAHTPEAAKQVSQLEDIRPLNR